MAKQSPIAIFGAGGHGKVLCDILLESGQTVAGFLDDNPAKKGSKVLGLPVLGGWEAVEKLKLRVALGVGDNKVREKLFKKAKQLGASVVSAIHPSAVVSKRAKLGQGVAVMAGAVINVGSSVEDGAVVNTGASVDHDCALGRFCQIWPGAHLAGSVTVGAFAYVGTGASVIPGISIGEGATIGAGAAVVCDIAAGVTAAGVPAKILKERSE